MSEFYWAIYADAPDGCEHVVEVFSRRKSALRYMHQNNDAILEYWNRPKVAAFGRSYDWVLSGGKVAGRGHKAPEPDVQYLSFRSIVKGEWLDTINMSYGDHLTIAAAKQASQVKAVESLLTGNIYYRSRNRWNCLRGRTWRQVHYAIRYAEAN